MEGVTKSGVPECCGVFAAEWPNSLLKNPLSPDLFEVGVLEVEGVLLPAGVNGTPDPSVPLPVLQVAPAGHDPPGAGSGGVECFWASAREAVMRIAQLKSVLNLVIALFSSELKAVCL